MVAWVHSPPAGVGAWQACLACERHSLVAISYVQVVGGALHASQTMDAALCRSAHQEHDSRNIHSLHFEWTEHLAQYHTFVDCIANVARW